MKKFLAVLLSGFLLTTAAACAGGDGGADCGTDCDAGQGEVCDANLDDSVFVNVVDDSTGEEICCPTKIYVNDIARVRCLDQNENCVCTWREDYPYADFFCIASEELLNLSEMNTIRVEMDGYLPWAEEVYVPSVCVPRVELTARLTPEPDSL